MPNSSTRLYHDIYVQDKALVCTGFGTICAFRHPLGVLEQMPGGVGGWGGWLVHIYTDCERVATIKLMNPTITLQSYAPPHPQPHLFW